MYIIDGIAYAGNAVKQLAVADVKILEDMMLLLTFNNNEERLYDVTNLLTMPAFKPLEDEKVFASLRIIDGVVTWQDGEIDIAPETMYQNSFLYERIQTM